MIPEVEKLVTSGKLPSADGDKLSQLTVGSFCRHKSWGAGRVAEWDLLGDRMVIDFEGKPGHAMKLSFATGSLDPLPESHLLAKRVGDAAGLKKKSMESPADVVELALKSFNNSMSLDQLEEAFVPRVMSAAEYKTWWSAAKKALKGRRHVVVPAKRTEMLVLRDEGASPVQAMIDDLQNARDLKAKLNAVARIQKDIDLFKNPATELVPVFSEINTAVAKSWKLSLKEALQLMLAGEELRELVQGAAPEGTFNLVEMLRQARPQLAEAVNGLPAVSLTRLYKAFPSAFPDGAWVQECLTHLTKTGGRAVGEIALVLDANGELDQLAEYLKKAVRNRQLSTDLLIWMCKERKAKAKGVFNMDLGNAVLGALEDDHIAGGPKRTGRLSDAFTEDVTLIPEMIADADADEVTLLSRRILATPVFDELTRRSLMGRIIKTRPETQELMGDGGGSADTSLIVSWESMERKKEELADLIKNRIPQNTKDIQIALGYGDLKENFEYKSARQQQAVLQRMQSKIQRDLGRAQGTDFANTPTDAAGIGTVVDMEDGETGEIETQSVLGAWDGDPDRNILSYLSEMAKAIIGKKVGDEAHLPTESGKTRRVKIAAIRAFKS